MAQEREALGINRQELSALAEAITHTAIVVEDDLSAIDFEEFEETLAALRATRERVAYMGWIADRIAAKLGSVVARGDADEWLLPPAARPSLLATVRRGID